MVMERLAPDRGPCIPGALVLIFQDRGKSNIDRGFDPLIKSLRTRLATAQGMQVKNAILVSHWHENAQDRRQRHKLTHNHDSGPVAGGNVLDGSVNPSQVPRGEPQATSVK